MTKTTNYVLTVLLSMCVTFGTIVCSKAQKGENLSDTEMLSHIFSTLDGTNTG